MPGCTWDPWIPGERSWNPDIVVNPSDLADRLALDTRHMDTLSCYTPLCEKRFRVVVEKPGTLAVSLVPELASDDAQARLVLEGIEGVLGQAGTGRGPHIDVPALAVGERVNPGVYFVLLEAVGGPLPYQLTARLTPGEGPPPSPAPLEDPLDRMIRRQIADELVRRGFHQATGGETADLLVDFSRRAVNRDFYGVFSLYDRYGFGVDASAWALGDRVETRGILVIDIVDARSERLAWHAQTSTGIGPGITPGAPAEALLREAVTEALLGFPPQ